jgi:outer membrane protein assembly factor BamB
MILVLLTATVVMAQRPRYLYTQPALPSEQALDRLNLKIDWHTYLPMDGKHDAILNYQLNLRDILIQTRSGALISLNAATGALQWRAEIGNPYTPTIGFDVNAKSVFAIKGARLYALDRQTGVIQWEYTLPNAAAAPPAADNEAIYVPLGDDRFIALQMPAEYLPKVPVLGKARSIEATAVSPEDQGGASGALNPQRFAAPDLSILAPYREIERPLGPQPVPIYEFQTQTQVDTRLEQESLIFSRGVLETGANGHFIALSKGAPLHELYTFDANAGVAAPLGQHGDLAYIPSQDFRMYALDMATGQIRWRFVTGGPIIRQPRVLDDDIYVATERVGLYRLNRATGKMLWRTYAATRFLAENKKFVYGKNSIGQLVILDRERGSLLTTYEAGRDFVMPLVNELTDRLFLASQDGLIVCLHDRDYPTPVLMKNVQEISTVPEVEQFRKAAPKPPAKPTGAEANPDT